jgi:hypothetical protein
MKPSADNIERTAARRAEWARTALQASANELHEVDAERSAAFAAEAERCAHLLDREEPRITRRGAWGA